MKRKINHYLINLHRDLQALYLRKVPPLDARLVDEAGVEERPVQPGRAAYFTTLDEIYLSTADMGALYVSALQPDGTLASGLSIAYSNGAYRIASSVAQTVWNLKVWSDNTATAAEQKAVLHDVIPANLWGWLKCDEGSGAYRYDSSGNGRHFRIPGTVDFSTHHAAASVQYSWQNEVGYTKLPDLAVPLADLSFNQGGGVVDGDGIKGTLTSDPAYYYFRIATLTLGPHFAGDGYEAATGLPLPMGAEVKVDFEIMDTNYPSYSVPEGEFYMSGAAANLTSPNRQLTTDIGPFTATHFVGDHNASTHINRVDFNIDTALNYTGYGGLFWKFGDVVVRPLTLIPRDESNTEFDVLGNPLTHQRRVKYDARLVESHCATFDGLAYADTAAYLTDYSSAFWRMEVSYQDLARTDDCWLFGRVGSSGASIAINNDRLSLSYNFDNVQLFDTFQGYEAGGRLVIRFDLATAGDNTISAEHYDLEGNLLRSDSVTGINFQPNGIHYDRIGARSAADGAAFWQFQGKLFDIKIYKGVAEELVHWYPCSSGHGHVLYDVVGGNHAVLQNHDVANVWSGGQPYFHYALLHGYSLYEHATEPPIRVPYGSDGQPLTLTPPSGYVLSGHYPAGVRHNGAETRIDFTGGVLSPWAARLLAEDANLEAYGFGDALATPRLHKKAAPGEERKFIFEKL